MRVKVKEWSWPLLQNKNVHLLIYLTVWLTFERNSFTSSMNSCNINAKKANLTSPQKCQGQLRSSLKILGQKSLKLSTKSYELAFSCVWRHIKRPRSTQGHYLNNLRLGWNLGLDWVGFWGFSYLLLGFLGYQMLHIHYQCHRLIGSGEDFESIWLYLGMKVVLVMWSQLFKQIFVPSVPRD